MIGSNHTIKVITMNRGSVVIVLVVSKSNAISFSPFVLHSEGNSDDYEDESYY